MRIVVDTNAGENALFEHIERLVKQKTNEGTFGASPPTVLRQRLDLGDVSIELPCEEADSSVIKSWLFERKTWSDWCASIVDGRYREQKQRFLSSNDGNSELVYMVEGNLKSDSGDTRGLHNRSANAALVKTALRDKLPILRTIDSHQSAEMIVYVAVQARREGLCSSTNRVIVGLDQTKLKRKRDNLTQSPSTMLCAMLSVIPGMSDARAQQVQTTFSSMNSIIQASESDLANVNCGKRKLGSIVAKRIKQVFI